MCDKVKPREGETHDNFIQRCMGNDTMREEYPDGSQRYAVCESYWESKCKTCKYMLSLENSTSKSTVPGYIGCGSPLFTIAMHSALTQHDRDSKEFVQCMIKSAGLVKALLGIEFADGNGANVWPAHYNPNSIVKCSGHICKEKEDDHKHDPKT